MSAYDVFMGLGLIALIGIVVKGFLSFKRTKPADQSDDPGYYTGGRPPTDGAG